jgi:hypothetical protein
MVKKQRDYHKPGYVPPSRDNTQMLGAHLPRPMVEAIKEVVAREGKTQNEFLQEVISDVLARRGVKLTNG